MLFELLLYTATAVTLIIAFSLVLLVFAYIMEAICNFLERFGPKGY